MDKPTNQLTYIIRTYICIHVINLVTYICAYIHNYIYRTYMYTRARECANLHSFAAHSKLNFYLRSFATMPTPMFAHVHLYNLNMHVVNNVGVFQKHWGVLLAASGSFLTGTWLVLIVNLGKTKTICPSLIYYIYYTYHFEIADVHYKYSEY